MLLDVSALAKQARPSDADLKQLADSLDKIADHTPYPFIGEHLPEQGLRARFGALCHGPAQPRAVSSRSAPTTGWDSITARKPSLRATKSPARTRPCSSPRIRRSRSPRMEFAGMLRRFTFDPPGDTCRQAKRAVRKARQFDRRRRGGRSVQASRQQDCSTRSATRARSPGMSRSRL